MNKERILQEAFLIYENKKTIREVAKIIGVSKSTVHIDVSKRLAKIDKKMYTIIRKILKENFEEKHIRGGESTKKKYQNNSKN